jgi:hypothetical protein
MGRAEDLFARIQREGIAAIETLISESAPEELFLEFKRSADDGQGSCLHERDRTHLRKAISGFANSEGGVVVWGIDCSKKADIGDVASAKVPLTNPARFVSWLEGAISGCTVPPVTGVRSISIPISGDLGFVATYIPQSSHAPHQMTGESRYMIRAGSNFVPAPHGVVAGLFGKPPHPVVFPNFILKPIAFKEEYVEAGVSIVLVNNGQVVAEDLFVSIWTPGAPKSGQRIGIDSEVSWPRTGALGIDHSWMCPREFRLAPGGFVSIAKITLIVKQPPIADFRCTITVGCKGAIPHSTELLVNKVDLETELQRIFESKRNADTNFDLHQAAKVLLGLPGESDTETSFAA